MDSNYKEKKILVVDDNPGDVESVRICIKEGFDHPPEIRVAATAGEAASIFVEESFDAVLLDLGLPDAIGLSALNELSRIRSNVPIIVLTGNTDSQTIVSALREGAQDYLSKNEMSPEYLHHALSYAIERSRFVQNERSLSDDLSSIAKAVPGLIYRFSVSKDGVFSFPYLSDKVFDLYGFSQDDERVREEILFGSVHEEDKGRLEKSLRKVVETRSDWNYSFRINHPTKGIRWLFAISQFNGIDDEGTLSWTGFSVDRTEELEQKEELLKLSWATDHTDTAIIITDNKGVTTWANPGFEKLSGFSRQELVGKKPGDLLQGPDTDPEVIRFISEKVQAGEAFQAELLNYRKGGESYWIALDVRPAHDKDGNHTGFVAVQSDITERKKRDDDLGRKAALLEAAAEISGVGGWEYEVSTGSVLLSEQTRAIHEIDDDYIYNVETALDFYLPEARAEVAEALRLAIEEGKSYHLEVPFRTAKGREILVETRGVPWVRDGKTERIIGAFRDVTEIREADARLLRAKEDAEAANLAKSQFLATMSHEIRTPLNAILGFSQILKEDPDNEDRGEFLDLIDSNGRMLTDLVSDILDFSKIEAGKVDLEPTENNLCEWIQEQVSLYKDLANGKGISLEWSVQPDLATYWKFDARRLQQVTSNLLRNAIKFTKKGAVQLSVEKHPESGIILSVTDTGIGIPSDKIDTIFDLFAQVDSSNTRKYGGTGLGLSICLRIVEMMGGTIDVKSEVGQGSHFRIHIPIEQTRSPSTIDESDDQPRKKGEVLLVEDNITNQKVMEAIIVRNGLSVKTCGHGESALDALKASRFNLIFMDLHMPIMDGLEATRKIRADSTFGNPKIVIFSASVQPSDREASLEAGADEFLPKPVNFARMKELLQMWGGAPDESIKSR